MHDSFSCIILYVRNNVLEAGYLYCLHSGTFKVYALAIPSKRMRQFSCREGYFAVRLPQIDGKTSNVAVNLL